MNTNQLKRFAKEARIKLLAQIAQKLDFVLQNTEGSFADAHKAQLHSLNNKIKEIGREQVIEMVAYTWFNRLMALRFMDANGYNVPKVLTPLAGMSNPEILQNALGGHIEDNLQFDRVLFNDYLDGKKTAPSGAHTAAYKMLLIAACNQWSEAMPFMFERISDYTELLLPDDLLSDFSIVADVRNGMSDEDCQEEEVIGWLYQFYIADKKDDVFNGLKKNIKITAQNIPAATQLFTPRWIVRYMVENTLGKLWLSLRPLSKIRDFMPYFIESPEGNEPAPIPEDLKISQSPISQSPISQITFLDPCQGSGHVLVYAFDLLTKIYEEEGYNTNEIPALILKNNLFGIDIDPRAAQLAAFALTMKARKYYTRFLRKPVQPNVLALANVSEDTIEQVVKLPIVVKGKKIEKHQDLSLSLLMQADNFGSLIQIEPEEVRAIQIQEGNIWQEKQELLRGYAELLSRQFHCVVTNPPYMGSGGMNDRLATLAKIKFPDSKSDLFSMFMERNINFAYEKGYLAMVTMQSWMFLGSFEMMRRTILAKYNISTLIQIGYNSFPELNSKIAQACSFVIAKNNESIGSYINLNDAPQASDKEQVFLSKKANNLIFQTNQRDFEKIPGSPIGYWLSKKMIESFNYETLYKRTISDGQTKTGDNNKFLREFWEISINNIGFEKKWVPYAKGGGFRKWDGNITSMINWSIEARTHYRKDKIARILPEYLWKKEGVTWGLITSSKPSFRLLPSVSIFDVGGSSLFFENDDDLIFVLSLLNSKIAFNILKIFNPTLNFQVNDIRSIPFNDKIVQNTNILKTTRSNISISKQDWDSRETSWDFQQNALIQQNTPSVKTAFESYKTYWTAQFYALHQNEEALNRQFIDIYGLQDELTPSVPLSEITILQEESKIVDGQLFIDPVPVLLQFVSYAVGCLFGRYSLDKAGLILANQGETLKDYIEIIDTNPQSPISNLQSPIPKFMPDEDNIIPVLEDEWFNDDIVGRFREFLKVAFGETHFAENLKYIEDTLGKDIRKYLVKDFYNDHVKRYKKRPIYWLFSSPKGHFKALIYMHRYQSDVCSKLLNDYVQSYITKLESAKQTQTQLTFRADITAREKAAAEKEIAQYEAMLKDCRVYEKTLFTVATQKIALDLDDGVKVNYQKFSTVLMPIKGLEKEE